MNDSASASPTQHPVLREGRPLIVALGTDHAGYELKEAVAAWLRSHHYTVQDHGCFSTQRCDYPVFVRPAAQAVADGRADVAVVFGGSGNGEAIVANKVRGVRCALCFSEDTARWARGHNDANAMALGARTITTELGLVLLEIFLTEPFEGGRHAPRVAMIEG